MKKLFLVLTLVLAVFVVSSCTSDQKLISEADARAKALNHAQLKEDDVTFAKTTLDSDDGKKVYEIEFYHQGTEYDYEVDAVTGDIVSFDKDVDRKTVDSSKADRDTASATDGDVVADSAETEEKLISEEEAINIALAKVEGATKDNARVKKDYDDGRTYYDVTIIYNKTEYEFEIDALTGNITEWDSESVYD